MKTSINLTQMNPKKVGAIVIGGEHPGLGIARSLGRKGIPVCVIDDQHSVSQFSKYVTRVVRVKDLRDEHRTIESVMEIGKRYGLKGWVLFPTRDETVAAFSRHRDQLAEFFRVTTPCWNTVRWAWDKKNTYDRAAGLGIPVPRTYNPRTEEELSDLYSRLPMALKPAVKENFFYATGAKAWRAETPDQLHDLFRRAIRQIGPEEILIQEIIPGDGQQQYSYCAFFRDGEAHSSLVARRIRQHPREFGRAATYVETVASSEVPEVEELSLRFLRNIDYYGLVEVEFKRDTRDGQFKLLDVNARTWGFHSIGSPAGVDFPYLLYADQTGERVEHGKGKAGVGWLRLITDLPTVAADLFSGYTNMGAYVESLNRTSVESVFCLEDVLPSVAEVVLLPYLVMKKYVLKEHPKPGVSTLSDPDRVELPASKTR
jgi:predicted ATP-grasp superfamily ATP-dependent carboligase